MFRPLRLRFFGAIYHVTLRGNARAAIYLTLTISGASTICWQVASKNFIGFVMAHVVKS